MSLATLLIGLIVASTIPIGAGYIFLRVPSVKWKHLLLAVGFAAIPLLIIVALIGGVSSILTATALGTIIGYAMTHLDDD